MTHQDAPVLYIKRGRTGPVRRQEKSRATLEGGYKQARLNDEIVTLCNSLINLCICCKRAFPSQRACA